ncbi:hypothetical protein EXZ48_26040 [Shinella sp. JR1-6]|nr:hypothetical protein EXZ48_26040 [Shinella sp. JR1-6]
MLAASAVIASACSPTEPAPLVRVEQRPVVLPEVARQPCANPRALPDRDLSSREVATNWGADRAALTTCETRRAAAVAAVDASEGNP